MSSNNDTPNVILIKIFAGLGNQFFQYALGRNLSLSTRATVKYDVSWFAGQTKRKYELGPFNVKATIATDDEVKRFQKYQRKSGTLNLIRNLFAADNSLYIQERGLGFDPKVLQTKPPAYIDGYWQSERYFSSVADSIRNGLTLVRPPSGANADMLDTIRNSRAIALHVRRGDYVSDKSTNAFHGTTTLEYYQRAIEKMKSIEPAGTIFVFSDDHKWVKENLRFGLPTVFVDINSAENGHEDLRLMAACRHHVIANSSFSWWGAWLGTYPQQHVIAPKRWFNDAKIDTQDLIPERWEKI